MKTEKNIKNRTEQLNKVQRLSTFSTAALIILMLIYLVMTVTGSVMLANQTDIITKHPFEVVIAVGDVKQYISEMNLCTERLQRHRNAEDIEITSAALAELYTSVEQPLAKLEELYRGDIEDVLTLKSTLTALKTQQDDFLTYVSDSSVTDEDIEAYEQTRLEPTYSKAIEEAEYISVVAQEKKTGYESTSEFLRKTLIIGSVILMTLTVGILIISQSVLRRQQQELIDRNRLLDNLSLSIDDTFIIQSESGAIQYTSLNIMRVLGSVPSDENIYHGLKAEDRLSFEQAIADPEFQSNFEKTVEYTKPDGEKRWMLIRVYKIKDAVPPQFITVFSDRTKEIQSHDALQDALIGAQQANVAKSEFLSRMSHEIRTPLNAVMGMMAVAATKVTDTVRVTDCLTKAAFSAKHLLMIVNDVLDMSKIDSNKMILQNEPFDIFEVINAFASTVYAQAKSKGVEFSETMEGFEGSTIFIGDELRLNQILLNLSSNAVKFTPPGGKIHLNVSRLNSGKKADIIRFVLSDTGIGMTEEGLEKIFKPFEQADASIAGRYGGTGLGMSITGNLVALMNGTIRVESELGKGSAFTVDIPFKRGDDKLDEQPDFENLKLSALVVDDEQQVCEQTVFLLDKIKIRSEYSLSATAALKRLSETHAEGSDFDICLIDWKMPDMDGIELTRRIRSEIGENVPIIMISAYDISEIEEEARKAGVNAFLPKPLYRSSVYQTIKNTMEGTVQEVYGGEQPLTGKRLLLVEDNAINREIAEELLKDKGAEVRLAADGKEALEMFLASEAGEFDAVLMDVQMPVMNGLEATQHIRNSKHPDAMTIPVIAVTANAFSDDISVALASGMNAHVSKPLDIAQLCRTLTEQMRARPNPNKD